MALMEVGLDDKYRLDAKRIFLSGTQALVRLPMLQRERDRAAGLNTAGFISGYRGSPLGMYDHALWRAKSFLKQHDIEFAPGLNEDLAATAVWGSQQVGMFPGAKVDGVFGIWYGKGPGVDRSIGRAQARQLGRHVAERRRDCARRRRPWLPVLDAGPSERAGICRSIDAGGQSGDAAGLSRSRHSWALRCRAIPAAGSASRRSRNRSKARPRSSAIPTASRSSRPTISRCRRAGFGIRWPDAPLEQERRLHGPKMAGGCGVHARQPLRPHRAGSQSRRGSASWRPARPISICGRRWPISASPMPRRRRWDCASTRSR